MADKGFYRLNGGASGVQSTKQAEIRLAGLLKILQISYFRDRMRAVAAVPICLTDRFRRFPQDMANLLKYLVLLSKSQS
jgi:hypothetical protein